MAKRDIRTFCLLLGFGFFLAIGCSHQQQSKQETITDPAAQLYESAGNFYQAGALEQALAQFNRYLLQYPQGPDADAALFHMGDIYHQLDDPGAAQAFWQRLIDEYPQSGWIDQAQLRLIEQLIANQDEAQAILAAEQMLTRDLPLPTRERLYQFLTRLYRNTGDLADTARFLFLQYQSAADESKQRLLPQLTALIERMEEADIQILWKIMDDHLIRSYLIFRYAMLQVIAENNEDALKLLSLFRSLYPDHILYDEVVQFISTLNHRMSFESYTVGCLLPLSGDYQLYGLRALNGIEMALSLVPRGETGLPIKIIVKDTASVDSVAVQGVRELAEARVSAIIGPILTATAAGRESQRLGIPMITFTQKPQIAAIGDWIFQHFITPRNQVDTLVNYLFQERDLRRFAVMYPDEPYGQTFMDLFWDAVIRKGAAVTGVEAYDPKLTDFADTIRKLVGTYYPIPSDLQKRPVVFIEEKPYYLRRLQTIGRLEEWFPDPLQRISGLYPLGGTLLLGRKNETDRFQPNGAAPSVDFDALFIPDAPKTVGLILPQLAYNDVSDVIVVGTNLWHSEQLVDMSKDFAQNALMVDGFFKDSQSGVVQAFMDGYRRLYGEDPGIIEAFAFDTANLIFSLLNRPDIQSRPDLRWTLQQSIIAQGATGPVYFAEDGEAIKHLSLLRLRGGRFVEIDRP